jgi:tetraacyldisaccharide 4'-kinase
MRAPAFWSTPPGAAAAVLAPAAALWAWAGRRRLRAAPRRVSARVVCVGNLVAGGAGKTPVVLSIAGALRRGGVEAHVLCRGHGGRLAGPVRVDPARHAAADVGDEALLHARAAPAWIARDRAAGAAAAAEAGAEVLLLDDGFQNPQPAKDLSLLVVDGEVGFGNGRVIPAGPLREPVEQGLARADAVVLLGDDRTGLRAALSRARPVLAARIEPAGDTGWLSGARVLAFAGIGRPAKFFAALAAAGAEVAAAVPFPDHHPYDPDEVMRLVERARALGAVPVTTAKDLVRLPPGAAPMVRSLEVAVRWEDPAALVRLLAPLLPRMPSRPDDGDALVF